MSKFKAVNFDGYHVSFVVIFILHVMVCITSVHLTSIYLLLWAGSSVNRMLVWESPGSGFDALPRPLWV